MAIIPKIENGNVVIVNEYGVHSHLTKEAKRCLLIMTAPTERYWLQPKEGL